MRGIINSSSFNRLTTRAFTSTTRAMGVQKTIITEGNGPSPKTGDVVTMEYTGWLKTADNGKGKQFDSTTGRGPFKTPIGVGRVIKGWDEGVVQMKLGEKATLDITSDYAYGSQ
jgi:FK506-binding protein 1